MVADGKENLHPNSPRVEDTTSVLKPKQTQFSNSFGLSQRFSDILFSDNGIQFSTSCASPSPSPPPLSLNEQAFNMNGLFNSAINTPSTHRYGAIGPQAPLLSSSSSTTSTNSDHQLDSFIWMTNGMNMKSFSPPADVPEFQSVTPFGSAENRHKGNMCSHCEVVSPDNHCFDCGVSLCNRCIINHLRDYQHKQHTIQKIRNLSPPSNTGVLFPNFSTQPNKLELELQKIRNNSPPSNQGLSFSNFASPSPRIELDNQCDMHYETLRYVCDNCKSVVCQECTLRDHKDHECLTIEKYTERPHIVIKTLMDKGAAGKQQIKQNIDRILQYSQHLEREANDLMQRVRKNARNGGNNANGAVYRNDDSDKGLAEIIEKFRFQKSADFSDQMGVLRTYLAGIASVTDNLKKFSINFIDFSQFQLAKALIESDQQIEHYLKQTRKLEPNPVNLNQFVQTLEISGGNVISNLHRLLQSNYGLTNNGISNLQGTNNLLGLANNNSATSMRRPIKRCNRGYQNNGQLIQNGSNGMNNWNGSSLLPNADLVATLNSFREFNISPPSLGTQINLGSNSDEPRANGRCIFNSDTLITAVQRTQPSVSFAFDGALDGQLSRPWGVCVDKDSNIIVGDRRNNRIQVFYPDGTFKFAFGSKGSGDGQLELPAGVTTDRQNRIIVADKDNHRIQIFSSTGRYILKFGGYGRDLGEFQYPWDVAVNSNGNIIVTDTRNHRVQMFTSVGHFITKYSFDSAYYDKNLKSHITPRGLCFTPNGDILVTDFENHRIMMLDGNLTKVKMVRGREGDNEVLEFNRPSGVCCDDSGRVVIADSKNQRVLVYNLNMELQWVLDVRRSLSTVSNEKDRPSDVAILPDGRIVVLFETSPDTKDCAHPLKKFVHIY